MGTRSTVQFRASKESTPVACIYQQYDGYIEGVGHELANFLNSKKICNGFNTQTMETHANGMGCLAAQYIKEKKEGIGGLYMTTPEDRQEYNYIIYLDDEDNYIIEVDGFVGTPDELLNFKDPQN